MRASTPAMLGLEMLHSSHSCRGSSGPKPASSASPSERMMRHCCSVTPSALSSGRNCAISASRAWSSSSGRLRWRKAAGDMQRFSG